jgi:DUF4097 and DUF4098 domain-containing protein YvlB
VRTETFATPGPVTLTVGIPSGDISLETADEPETHVELDASDEEALAQATIELRRRGDRYEVVVEAPKKFRLLSLRSEEYRLSVRAPHGADFDMSTASADVEARGRYGSVDLNSASGDASFDEVEGDAQINTASGDLRLTRIGGDATVNSASGDVEVGTLEGRGKIRSASGDVSVDVARSSLTVQSASGDQEVGSIASGQVTLQSASGDIEVGLAKGASLWIDAKSMSGETTSELELEGAPPDEGEADVDLRAASMSGDITVKRA